MCKLAHSSSSVNLNADMHAVIAGYLVEEPETYIVNSQNMTLASTFIFSI